LQLNSWGHSPYVTSSLTRGWVFPLWICFAFVKRSYRTYGIGLHGYAECFSSRESVSLIKVLIWIEEPLMGFEMCLWEQSPHLYVNLAAVYWTHSVASKCHLH
jgi:hypothetical protein